MSVNSEDEFIQLGIHWPDCIDRSCRGCMPKMEPLDSHPVPRLDLSIFRKDAQ